MSEHPTSKERVEARGAAPEPLSVLRLVREQCGAYIPASVMDEIDKALGIPSPADNVFRHAQQPAAVRCGWFGEGRGQCLLPEGHVLKPTSRHHVCEQDGRQIEILMTGLAAVHEAERRASQPSKPARTDEDYAIEHGRYLATVAEEFLKSVNQFDEAAEKEANVDDDDEEARDGAAIDVQQACESRADHWQALESAVYEFRKRADRARPVPTKPDVLKCASCEGEDDVAVRPICSKSPICKHCFAIWYDGCTDAEQIRRESLKAQGRAEKGENDV
jgi:hypothetical protein